MKKIFLLSLLSVFFLSAFCQIAAKETEVLARINVLRSADALASGSIGEINDAPELGFPDWWFLYKTVKTERLPNGSWLVTCQGKGWKLCFPSLRIILQMIFGRGVSPEAIELTCENLLTDSEELAANGMYTGSVTRKMAFPNPEVNGKECYLLFQMNWNYSPENPYNGTAEIIISKTNNFGLK